MMTVERTTPAEPAHTAWSYEEAFSRHEGLFTREEQEKLRNSRVAIIGMGGVGGVHLITLTRLGIGKFTIADPDVYELANFNRQYGASLRSLGRPKVDVMAEEALAINPELDIRRIHDPVSPENVGEFLDGADILVDGVDFFALEARRLVFRKARERGIWGITAGPHAFGSAWMLFDPHGMTFDRFFDLRDDMSATDKLVAFSVGCVPSPLHLGYVNLATYFRPGAGAAASLGLACNLAAGITAAQVAKIILQRSNLLAAPWYGHFDAYRQKLACRKLRGGNRHPWQRLKRWWLRRRMEQAMSPKNGLV